jgi:diguanylate cyclase (GGDEF)-like protein/PAS domain S-box-containing protein
MEPSYESLKLLLHALSEESRFVVISGTINAVRNVDTIEGELKRLGYVPDDLKKGILEYDEMLHPNDREAFRNALSRALEYRQPHLQLSYRIRDRDDNIFWIEDYTAIDYTHPIPHYVTILYDRSEDILKQRELENTRNLLEQAQAITHIGSWELDLVHNELSWSDEIYRIFEIDPDIFGASYEAFLDAVHPDDREMVDNAYTRSLDDRKPYKIEHRLLLKDGRVKYVEERCVTTFDDMGRPLISIGTVQDITTAKRISAAAAEQKNLIRSVIDTTPDLIFYKDYRHSDGTYLGCNRAFEAFSGKSESELTGKNDLELFGDVVGTFFRARDRDVLRSQQSIANEEWVTYPDGRKVLLQTLKTPFFDTEGMLWGLVGTSRDITERWEAEEKIRSQQEQIAHQAHYDALTDLPNRFLFNERLHHAAASINKPGSEFFALFFIDLDNFKQINDTYGHAVGDEVLVIVASRLRSIFRKKDTIARLGGDEFIVLVRSLKQTDMTGPLAEKILTVFREPIHISKHDIVMTVSIGISLYPEDTHDPETLLKYADKAMYRAKTNGRDTYRFFRN